MKRTQLITAADLSKEEVDFLIEEAEKMRGRQTEDLKGKIVATLFFEPSTRTRLSFETATYRLGGNVITVADAASTSMKKGETLADTIRVIESYADILVMRHPTAGSAEEAIQFTKKPFLNAGDGGNQHPTQALLDLYTIKKEVGRLDHLKIGFGFDPKHSRTIRSLALLLTHFEGNEFTFVSPPSLEPETDVLEGLKDRGGKFTITHDLDDYKNFDVFYSNRLQEERFSDHDEFEALRKKFVITKELAQNSETIILNPLPRVDEIDSDVDQLQQAAYFRQAENGVYMRMALLKYLSGNYSA